MFEGLQPEAVRGGAAEARIGDAGDSGEAHAMLAHAKAATASAVRFASAVPTKERITSMGQELDHNLNWLQRALGAALEPATGSART
eukprot:SAG11_NODE_450_length_9391_cov_16.666272_5_plen_87_part_00